MLSDTLKQIDERNGVGEAHLTDADEIKEYVQTQINEMKRIIMRNRVDILLNEKISVEGRAEKDGRDAKIRDLESTVVQMVEAVDVLTKLHEEL